MDDLLEYAKDRYNFEHERRGKINGEINLIVTIVIVLAGVVVFFLKNVGLFDSDVNQKWFYSTAGLSILFLVLAVYQIMRSLFGHKYDYLPSPAEVYGQVRAYEQYYNNEYFKERDSNTKEKLTKEKIAEQLLRCYISACDQNTKSNGNKTAHRIRALRCLTISTIFIIFSAPLFFIKYTHPKQDITRVEILNWKESMPMSEKPVPSQEPKPLQNVRIENTAPSKPTPPAEPKPLQNTRINEGAVPPNKKG